MCKKYTLLIWDYIPLYKNVQVKVDGIATCELRQRTDIRVTRVPDQQAEPVATGIVDTGKIELPEQGNDR